MQVRRRSRLHAMIDYFALALTHGLLLVGLLRLLTHEKLDHENVKTLAQTDAAQNDTADTGKSSETKPVRTGKDRSQHRKRG